MATDSSLSESTLLLKKLPLLVNTRLRHALGKKNFRKRADTSKSVNGQRRMNGSTGLR